MLVKYYFGVEVKHNYMIENAYKPHEFIDIHTCIENEFPTDKRKKQLGIQLDYVCFASELIHD